MQLNVMRRALLCSLAILASQNSFSGDAAKSPLAGRRPNIIFVLTDDQGYGDASCNGNPILKTPNIDTMHREGVHFEDFHVSPTCAPTRSALMTGKHEFHNGVTHTIFERERLSLKSTTIAQILKASGYTTGIFGKWHLGDEPERWPSKRGFDEMFIHGAGGIGQGYPGTCGDVPGNRYFDPVILHNGNFEKTSGYCTDVFFGQALKWIEAKKGNANEPFFAYIATNAPHEPLHCPTEYSKPYEGKVGKGKAGRDTAAFFGMIANIDDNLGKLLAKVKEWKLDENTLIVFMNDNGGTNGVRIFNAGMAGAKVTAHNGGTRAMSLWRWPGTIKPAACSKLTAHLDFFPTIAELAGAKVPDDVMKQQEGHSLLPLLSNPESSWDDERILYTHVGRWEPGTEPAKYGGCSVRWKQYLMLRAQDKWKLFDLNEDPGEKKDIAGAHSDVVQKLDKAYDAWWTETLAHLENEEAATHLPKINPMKELYWKQFNGPGPNNVPPRKEGLSNQFFAMDTGARGEPAVVSKMLQEIGYDGLGGSPGNAGAMAAALDARGLRFFNAYTTIQLQAGKPALSDALKHALDEMEGYRSVLWLAVSKVEKDGKAIEKSSPDGDEIAAEALREIVEYARPLNVRISLYPHTGFWIERVEDALRVAEKSKRPLVGVTFNLCHWLKVEGGRDPEPVLRAAAKRLNFVTVNGSDKGDTKAMGWDKLIQTLDKGSYDVGAFLTTLRGVGYKGPIGLQGYGIGGDQRENLTRSMAAWRKISGD